MFTYSVAIRTLGTSKETLRKELISIHNQSVPPERICIYIAEGYEIPDFKIGREEYFPVKKGMVSQRALQYDEISSDCILMLDDDVELAQDSAEKLLREMEEANADCMAADTFFNHKMSCKSKLKAIVTGFIFPRLDQKWAFKIHNNDSFSYINKPSKNYYPSMSAAGPASLWKKEAFLSIKYQDEKWLDELDFAYGDDALFFYKLFVNKGKLYVSFDSEIKNLDAKSASSKYQKDPNKLYYRAFSNFLRWHRTQFATKNRIKKRLAAFSFLIKEIWIFLLHCALSVKTFSAVPFILFIKGNKNALSYIKSEHYKCIPSFIIDK